MTDADDALGLGIGWDACEDCGGTNPTCCASGPSPTGELSAKSAGRTTADSNHPIDATKPPADGRR